MQDMRAIIKDTVKEQQVAKGSRMRKLAIKTWVGGKRPKERMGWAFGKLMKGNKHSGGGCSVEMNCV